MTTPDRLTSRQREILKLIAHGMSNKEMAELLNVCVKTIEFHRSRLTARLGTHGVAQLTLLAIREGLLDTLPTRKEGETRV